MRATSELSNYERQRCWKSVSHRERIAAGWKMTAAYYTALGLYTEDQRIDKTLVQRSIAEAIRHDDM